MRRWLPGSLAIAVTVAACNSSTTAPSNTGTLSVMLRDSPFSDAKALLVTLSALSAHLSGSDFQPVPFAGGAASRTCDLKKLATAQDVLGTGTLVVGHYTELRLVVASAALYFDNPSTGPACAPSIQAPGGRSAAVNVPSGDLRLNQPFDVMSAGTRTILLDFDGDQSVKDTGNGTYTMTPVVRVVSVQ